MRKNNQKRADGRFAVQVYLGKEDGKRKYKTVYGKTQKEANQKADELRLRLMKGIDVAREKETFSVWCERWLDTKKVDIGPSQYQSYKCYIKHLNSISHLPLSSIKAYDIQSIINDLYACNPNTGKPACKKTLTDIKNTVSQVFRFAVENRVIEYNPADAVKVPKTAPKSTRRALTEEEQEMITNTPHRMQTAAMIMLYAGLRRGELIPLLWSDIDLKNRTISVNKAVDLSTSKPIEKSTKTEAGRRTVHIPKILSEYLLEQPRDNILVCPSLSGGKYTADSWQSSWNTYLFDLDIIYGKIPQKKSKYDCRFKGITIDRITPHMLRHTCCTNLILAGVDVSTVQREMGHSDIKTTLAVYTHITDKHAQSEVSKLDAYFEKCKSNASQEIV